MSNLQSLFLEEVHLKHGAKLGSFAGYNMPIQYSAGLLKEHLHTRDAASLFDVSHMGQIHISGDDAESFLNRVLPIQSEKIKVGRSKYTVMLNDKGGIIDDLIVTRKSEEMFFVVLNAACMDKDMKHLLTYAKEFSHLKIDVLDDRCLCAVQGPRAVERVTKILENAAHAIEELKFMSGCEVVVNDHAVWINRSGYTGEDGVELSIPHAIAKELVSQFLEDEVIKPAGLGARNSLRLEAGLSLYGNDMDETTNVYEADLGFAVSKLSLEDESRDFIGAAPTRKAKQETPKRKRVGIISTGKAPIREHVELFAKEGWEDANKDTSDRIGEVCSGGYSPTLEKPITFAYLDTKYSAIGTTIYANVRGKYIAVKVCELPFVEQRYKR